MPAGPGLERIERLEAGGFSQDEIQAYVDRRSLALMDGGFTHQEVIDYWSEGSLRQEDVDQAAADYINSLPRGLVEDVGVVEAARLGLQSSVGIPGTGIGMLGRESLPEAELGPGASRAERIAHMLGAVAGDIPAMGTGFLIAGGAGAATGPGAGLVGLGGAFALPAGLRQVLVDMHVKGPAELGDVWDRLAAALIAEGKGFATGVSVGTAAGVTRAGAAKLGLSRLPTTAAVTGAEVGAMVGVGSALEGHVPTADDFIDAAIMIGGLKVAIGGPKWVRRQVAEGNLTLDRLRRTYVRTGKKPAQVVKDAKTDRSVAEDLNSVNQEVPRSYQAAAEPVAADPLVMRAAALVASRGNASARTLQRGMKITRGEAELLLDHLEAARVVGERPGAEPNAGSRRVMVDSVEQAQGRVQAMAEAETSGVAKSGSQAREVEAQQAKAAAEASVVEGEISALEGRLSDLKSRTVKDLREAGELGPKQTKKARVQEIEAELETLRGQQTQSSSPGESTQPGEAAAEGRPGGGGGGEPPDARGPVRPEPPPPPENPTPLEAAREHLASRVSIGETTPRRRWSFNDWYRDWVDRLHPIAEVQRAALAEVSRIASESRGKPTKIEIKDTLADPYKRARLHMGVAGKANHFLEFSPFDFKTGERVGRSLRDILTELTDRRTLRSGGRRVRKPRVDLDDFRYYGVAKRSIELEARGITTGVDQQAAQTFVRAMRDTMEPVFTELREYQSHVLKYLRDSGVISAEAMEVMEALNRDYVPFHRLYEPNGGAAGAPAALKVTDPIFRMQGSERVIHDPLESIIKNTYAIVEMAERNGVLDTYVRFAEQVKDVYPGLAKLVSKTRAIHLSKSEKTALVERVNQGEPLSDAQQAAVQELFTIFRPETLRAQGDRIAVFRDGQRQVYEVPREIADTFNVLTHETATTVGRLLAAPVRLLRAGAVLAPEFVARNPIRDSMVAFLQSDSGFRFLVDTTYGAFHVAGKTKLYQEWLRSGGPMSELVALDRRYQQKTLFELTGETSMFQDMRNVVRSPIEALRILSSLSEQATRVGEFRLARKAGESLAESGFRSREVAPDFGRIGARAQGVNMLIAFFNAQVQGLDKMLRVMKEHPGRTAYRSAYLATASLLLYLANRDEEGWDQIPQYEKDMSWLVPTKEQTPEGEKTVWWRIPKPFQFGMLTGTLAERSAQFLLDQDPSAFDGFMRDLAKMSAPGVIPTAALPALEIWANRSTFTDRPVIPIDREGGLPEYQYTPYTTELTKAIGAALADIPGLERAQATSPAVIEHAIRGWTGGLGTHFLHLADAAGREAGLLPERFDPEDTFSDIPFVKAFAVRHPSAGAQSVIEFYDEAKGFEQLKRTSGMLERDLEIQQLTAFLTENPYIPDVASTRQSISEIGSLIRKVWKLPDMDPKEKRQVIDQLYFLRIEFAKVGLDIIEANKVAIEAMQEQER